MIKTEDELYDWLQKQPMIKEHGIILHRLESMTGRGFPDVLFTNGRINGFIELKILHTKKLESWCSLNLSFNQLNFLIKHPATFVLCASKEREPVLLSYDTLFIIGKDKALYTYLDNCPTTLDQLV